MMFGDPSDFAIEAASDTLPGAPPGTVWGHMCVWCCRESIGDFSDEHCGLSGAHQSFVEIAADIRDLRSSALMGLNDAEIWNRLDQALYVNDDRTSADLERESQEFGRFDFLTNWDEPFDGYKCFILSLNDQELRILVRGPNEASIRAFTVSADGFRKAVAGFDQWCRLTPIERSVADAWHAASRELGLAIASPANLNIGGTRIGVPVIVHEFGRKDGTVVLVIGEPSEGLATKLECVCWRIIMASTSVTFSCGP